MSRYPRTLFLHGLVLTVVVDLVAGPDFGVNVHETFSVTEPVLFFRIVLPLEVNVTLSVLLPAAVNEVDPDPSFLPADLTVQAILPADGNTTLNETDPLEARPAAVDPEIFAAALFAAALDVALLCFFVVGGFGIE